MRILNLPAVIPLPRAAGCYFLLLLLLLLPSFSQTHSSKNSSNRPGTPRKVKKTEDDNSPAAIQQRIEERIGAAKAALATGNTDQIIKADRRVVALGLELVGDLTMIKGHIEEGVGLYKEALQYEDVAKIHEKLGIANMRLQRPNEAMKEALEVIRLEPNDPEGWRLKGDILSSQEDYKGAAEAFARALKLGNDVESAYSLAVAFLGMHQPAKADLVFDDMKRNYGDSAALHVLIGRAYRDAGDNKRAMAEFERALRLDPKAPHAHYFIGVMLLAKAEWQDSDPEIEKQLQAELAVDPHDYLANYLLGAVNWQKHDDPASLKYSQAAVDISPDQPDAWLYLGMAAYDSHDFARAEPALRKAIALTGSDESRNGYMIRRAYFDLARILAETGRSEESEKYFAKVREFQQLSLQQSQQSISKVMADAGAQGMGAVVPLVSKQMEKGDKAYDSDSKLTPQQLEQAKAQDTYLRSILGTAFNDLGTAEARRQNFPEALQSFENAAKWQPDTPGLQRNLGLLAARLEKYPEAVSALSQQITAHPDDALARAMLGVSEYNVGNYPAAVKALGAFDEKSLQDPRIGLPYAVSLVKTGDVNQAAAILKQISQQPSLPTETLLVIGQSFGDAQHYDDAIAMFNRALAENSGLAQAHYDAGLAYLKSDRPQQAMAEFESELKVSPHDVKAKYDLAYTMIQQSMTDKALVLLQEITTEHPEHADAQYQLGKLMLDRGNVDQAIQHLEAAAKLAPDKDFIHYQLQTAYRRASRTADANRELETYKTLKAQKTGRAQDDSRSN